MSQRSLLLFLVALLIVGFTRPTVEAAPGSLQFLYTATPEYEPLAWLQGADRFPRGAQIFVHGDAGQHPLVPSFAASADAALSFDSQRVLFAGKQKPLDHWQIWELSLPDGTPRRVASGADDCIRPLYLPEDRLVFTCRVGGRFEIRSAPLSGGKSLPLTYGAENAIPTDVLRDGRILFESAYGANHPEIYTVYSDGSGIESYRCDHDSARHGGRQVSSGDIIFVSGSALAKFTSARAKQVSVAMPTGEYLGEIAETSSGDWLFPWRAAQGQPYQLMLRKSNDARLYSVAREPEANFVEPVVIAERAIPNRHPSGLHDWPNANLLCLNAYTSKYKFAAGSIHSVKVYTRDPAGAAKLLGEAPVEGDGSFFVQVPNDQPIQMELLDAAGKTLKRESGFFWARRGEQRVCVGCHSGPETSPENAVPMTLLKSTIPVDLTGAHADGTSGGH